MEEMLPGLRKYPHIFSPIMIGKLKVKNRVKYASTETNFNYRDGYVSDKEVGYMEAQARGGAGIVTTQGAYTDPRGEGRGYVGMMAIWDDKFIPGLKRLADVIHKHGSASCLQLMHCGRVGAIELSYSVGPSAVPQKLPLFRPPIEMSKDQIKDCIQEHIDGARRAVEAGYMMIEISGIVGYLLSNYVSSYTNKRTDEYGGDIRGRMKFVMDIIKGCKEVCGDVPVGIRLCGEELLDDRGGNTIEESLQSCILAEEAGIDYLSVTAGWQECAVPVITRDVPMGGWLYIAERMKKNLKVPVSMAYRLFGPELPEKAMSEGKLDIWEMCRPMIADPLLPIKIMEDRQQDIIPCIACNVCLARLFRDTELCCTVNPALGHENEVDWGQYGWKKDPVSKKVAIVGAGIAGLQAGAIIAAKGHDVTIYEKRDVVGGQFEIASNGPWGDEELMRMVRYLKAQCDRYGAKVVMNKTVTADDLKSADVDAVIIATGAVPDVEAYAGSDKKNVCTCFDILQGKVKPGKNTVLLGGKAVSIATALYIINKYKDVNVSIVGPQKKFGPDVNISYVWRYMLKLKQGKVNQMNRTTAKEIVDDGVIILDAEKKEVKVPADLVVIADLRSNTELKYGKYGKAEVFMIGDAIQVRRGYAAIHDGYRMGMKFSHKWYQLMHRTTKHD